MMTTEPMPLRINLALSHVDLREPVWMEKWAGIFDASALLV